MDREPVADLDAVRQAWTRLAEDDPLWAILSQPGKQGGRWDEREFFRSGEREISELLARLADLGLEVGRETCLDFGCGVGRLTQPLAAHFGTAHGVDIAEPMIEHARRYNRAGDRCHYHLNIEPNLRLFEEGKFDLVYSNIVLQHMPPAASLGYLGEFVRVLRPGGTAVFQVPAERQAPPLKPGQTRNADALPYEAFRATIEMLSPRRRFRPGARRRISLLVGNASAWAWPVAGTADGRLGVRVANQWRADGGRVVRRDDGRETLPRDLAPDQTVKVELAVEAPRVPGRYQLVLDLVQEDVAWFSDRGSPPLSVPVTVSGRPVAEAVGPTVENPGFEMHAVPREDVEAVVAAAGGRVVAALPDRSTGDNWVSYMYVATKLPR
ncbi:MAG: class I SAM-dependent methyltransferase [Actinomycetota bacterium]